MAQRFLKLIHRQARQYPAKIVLPESGDARVQAAARKIAESGVAYPILIWNTKPVDITGVEILDARDPAVQKKFLDRLLELRGKKGLTEAAARASLEHPDILGTLAVEMGHAEGMISGATGPTAETLRAAFQIIGTKKKFHKVSGFFFMVLEKRLLLFADCAVNIEPSSHELADIAIDTAETAKRFGLTPRIAMLSFSTHGSAHHPSVDRVREATEMVHHLRPDLICEGEMQVDAALVPDICSRKFPGSKLAGRANILIFPNLAAGNIAYKLVERLGGAKAIGPILQGLKKPINDLSRGCSVEDIVNLAAITSVEAHEECVVPGHLIRA